MAATRRKKRRSGATKQRRGTTTTTAATKRRRSTGTTSAAKRHTRKSPLSTTTNQRRNTQTGRARMSRSNFALPKGTGSKPGQDQYRIDDRAHARNALSRVAQHGTPDEKRKVRRKVAAKYPGIGQAAAPKRKKKKRS